jgi:cytosine/adenosine deaminase-related metal-dependent hydrolase
MTPDQMRTVAQEARRLGLRLHSHLSETVAYIDAVHRQHGMSPVDFVESLGWLGPDVWFAHLVHLAPEEIARLGGTGTGIAHCPQSNGRLGSGIAPVLDLAAAGAPVSLGVDGAASNEAADMVSEAHAAWLMSRARDGLGSRATVHGGAGEAGVRMATVEQVIHWGTAGGARVLGLDAVGTLAPGQAADIALFDLDCDPRGFGLHDRLAAPVVGGGRAHLARLFVAGRVVVRDGAVPGLDLLALGREAARQVRRLQAAARG